MDALAALDEHEVDALLGGAVPAGSDLGAVAEVARSLRLAAAQEQVPPIGAGLRAQLDAAPVRPGSPASRRSVRPWSRPRRRLGGTAARAKRR